MFIKSFFLLFSFHRHVVVPSGCVSACLIFLSVFFLVFEAMILFELLLCLVLARSLLVDAALACVGRCASMVLLIHARSGGV